MGIFSSSTKKDNEADVNKFLVDGESIISVHALMIDYAALTNKRVIFVDRTAASNTLFVTVTIPFSRIDTIELENKALALTNKLTIISRGKAYDLKFNKEEDVLSFYKQLTERICN
ncbi:PH domain-containing protein [Paenibacillus sp. KQZ6P-2]|uniref:PH domain-containing protein n=1 Tax=Paenibacillus mangrovi TaxID=2931978 RepID=A0A9X1WUF8_9BACL|nr:PH domain-containing protein [Paenibacillus mangrovi]MCJ8015203.1 PH domain-containing protein [Paenibacillus mangrovi]